MRGGLRILLLFLVPLALVVGAVVAARDDGGPVIDDVRLPDPAGPAPLPSVAGDPDLPLVVIDPGHGGHDTGAAGASMVEKDLVLGLAKALQERLQAQNIARVALTRDDDRYLLHSERFEIARRLGAAMFISIHADSAGEDGEVAGASIYTLSSDASSDAARRFAARENASDRLNGIEIGDQSDAVSSILVELSQRQTQDKSQALAELMLRSGRETIRFHPQPIRSAALKVLRAPDIPSVLFESGFITNPAEAARLASPEGRRRFAEVMARAIRVYFVRNRES